MNKRDWELIYYALKDASMSKEHTKEFRQELSKTLNNVKDRLDRNV